MINLLCWGKKWEPTDRIKLHSAGNLLTALLYWVMQARRLDFGIVPQCGLCIQAKGLDPRLDDLSWDSSGVGQPVG